MRRLLEGGQGRIPMLQRRVRLAQQHPGLDSICHAVYVPLPGVEDVIAAGQVGQEVNRVVILASEEKQLRGPQVDEARSRQCGLLASSFARARHPCPS